MPERASVHYEVDEINNRVLCTVRVTDGTLIGHAAELRLERRVVVHDSRPVNESDVVFKREIPSLQLQQTFEIHRSSIQAYSYSGSKISVELSSRLEIDDGMIFDTTLTEEEDIILGGKPAVTNDAKGVVEPADAFDFITNLKAIPAKNQIITLMLLVAGAIVIAINSFVGIHDQMSPDHAVWFYDHRDSDGDSESPLAKSLTGSGVIGTGIWFAMRRQLRKYMTFEICNLPGQIGRTAVFTPADFLRGNARIDLHHVTLRVVACNMEKGQYTRGSGTKKRTVSFTEPVRAVILYDSSVPLIPKGSPVERAFSGEIPFEPMFRALYPPQMTSSSHGITLHWEVQLIHDELVDQELVGPVECFAWRDFLEA